MMILPKVFPCDFKERKNALQRRKNRISRLDAELDKLKRELKTNNSPGVQDDLEKLQKRVGELEDLKTSKDQGTCVWHFFFSVLFPFVLRYVYTF